MLCLPCLPISSVHRLARRQRRVLTRCWVEVADERGQRYFWNQGTGETAWERPAVESSNQELEALFTACACSFACCWPRSRAADLFTPDARFDYPFASKAFTELVDEHRHAVYDRPACFYEHLSLRIDALPPGGALLDAPAAPVQQRRAQSTAVAGVAMFDEDNLRWNTTVRLTQREALESIRARLANPDLRDPL